MSLRAVKFGLGFWILVLLTLIWYGYIHPNPEFQLLIPTEYYFDYCGISPFATWVLDHCSPSMTVFSTDSLIFMFLTMFVVMMVWLFQIGILAAIPIIVFMVVEGVLEE